ncbi:MAG: hypothetical protein ABI718_03010 [Acidobacteriota bacterium]
MTREDPAAHTRMRHVPPLSFVMDKIDNDYRRRALLLYDAVFERSGNQASEALDIIAAEFASLCRCIERIGELTRHGRLHHGPHETPRDRIQRAIEFAMDGLKGTDGENFGRRETIHSFDKSDGETIYAALLVVGFHLRQLTEKAAVFDPDIYADLMAHSVVQRHPVNEEVLKPIA